MRPPIFLFDLAEKKDSAAPGVRKKRALLWSQVTACGQNHIRRLPNVGMSWVFQCPLPLSCTARTACVSRTGGSLKKSWASRGAVRGTIPVRKTTERQRKAGPAATHICFSGDMCSSHRLPLSARSPEETSSGRLSLWSVRTVSLSANRKEKWFLKYAACCLRMDE